MSNSLDPDQARRFVGPDLGPNCQGYQQTTLVDKKLMHGTLWKHLCTKVTQSLQLRYSKNGGGGIWGWNQNDKKQKFSLFLYKIICCGYLLYRLAVAILRLIDIHNI